MRQQNDTECIDKKMKSLDMELSMTDRVQQDSEGKKGRNYKYLFTGDNLNRSNIYRYVFAP